MIVGVASAWDELPVLVFLQGASRRDLLKLSVFPPCSQLTGSAKTKVRAARPRCSLVENVWSPSSESQNEKPLIEARDFANDQVA